MSKIVDGIVNDLKAIPKKLKAKTSGAAAADFICTLPVAKTRLLVA